MATTPQHMAREIIAGNIRALMGRHKTSQDTLAREALGKKQPAISKRLSGEVAFDVDDLLAIARYYNVEVTALLDGISEQGESSSPWTTTQIEGQLALLDSAA